MTDESQTPKHALNYCELLKFVDGNTSFAVEEIDVSPLEAAYVLKHRNSCNRPLRLAHATSLSRDIRENRWRDNGETMKFSRSGLCLDGQHRLYAMSMLGDMPDGFTVRFLIVAGLPDEVQHTMDQGAKRSLGDMLAMGGKKNAAAMAAIARKAYLWEKGFHRFTATVKPTVPELEAFIEKRPQIHRATEVAMYVRSNLLGLPPSVVGVAHMVFTEIDPESAPWFFERLADGASLPPGHPILTFRRRINRMSKESGVRVFHDEYMAMLIRTWNAVRENKTLDKLMGIKDNKMPMPE